MLEGGPMVDCGTHQIDLALFWLGSPVTRFSSHGAWVEEYQAPDHMWLHMDHANGAHTMVEMSYSYHHTSKNATSEFVYELIGTEGVIRYDRSARRFAMESVEGSQTFEFHPEKSFAGMYAEWARALGVKWPTVWRWETGEREPSETVLILARLVAEREREGEK